MVNATQKDTSCDALKTNLVRRPDIEVSILEVGYQIFWSHTRQFF